MKKNKINLFVAGTALAYTVGIAGISVSNLDKILEILQIPAYVCGGVGIGFILLGILLTIVGARLAIEQDEEAKREEYDERNCMIRGKAAENAMLFITVAMLVTECVFMVMGSEIESNILAGVMAVCVLVWIGWICYYQKKY